MARFRCFAKSQPRPFLFFSRRAFSFWWWSALVMQQGNFALIFPCTRTPFWHALLFAVHWVWIPTPPLPQKHFSSNLHDSRRSPILVSKRRISSKGEGFSCLLNDYGAQFELIYGETSPYLIMYEIFSKCERYRQESSLDFYLSQSYMFINSPWS